LIENAIQHGLEPKVEGGKVEVKAQVKDGRLHISVLDDGLGLEGSSRSLRRGSGMALENLRARLHARYGPCATLTLSSNPTKEGTCVVLELPYEGKP
jgi:sensor histidine kinase YesM